MTLSLGMSLHLVATNAMVKRPRKSMKLARRSLYNFARDFESVANDRAKLGFYSLAEPVVIDSIDGLIPTHYKPCEFEELLMASLRKDGLIGVLSWRDDHTHSPSGELIPRFIRVVEVSW